MGLNVIHLSNSFIQALFTVIKKKFGWWRTKGKHFTPSQYSFLTTEIMALSHHFDFGRSVNLLTLLQKSASLALCMKVSFVFAAQCRALCFEHDIAVDGAAGRRISVCHQCFPYSGKFGFLVITRKYVLAVYYYHDDLQSEKVQ